MIKNIIVSMLFFCATSFSFAKDEPKASALPTPVQTPTQVQAPTADLATMPAPTLAQTLPAKHTPTPTPVQAPPPSTHDSDALAKEIGVRKLMLDWSRHLGVTCNFCHDTNNFKNDEKLAFKVGLKHKSLVRLLNEEVFTERDKGGALKVVADCYMCHRGYSTPQFKEPPQNLMK